MKIKRSDWKDRDLEEVNYFLYFEEDNYLLKLSVESTG